MLRERRGARERPALYRSARGQLATSQGLGVVSRHSQRLTFRPRASHGRELHWELELEDRSASVCVVPRSRALLSPAVARGDQQAISGFHRGGSTFCTAFAEGDVHNRVDHGLRCRLWWAVPLTRDAGGGVAAVTPCDYDADRLSPDLALTPTPRLGRGV